MIAMGPALPPPTPQRPFQTFLKLTYQALPTSHELFHWVLKAASWRVPHH